MSKPIYGNKYDGSLNTTEIAKAFRADLKAAQKVNLIPNGIKFSVKTRYFSMGSSIDVRIKGGVNPVNPEYTFDFQRENRTPRYTPEATALRETILAMLNAYNFDGSDPMSDSCNVNFFAHVQFDEGSGYDA
jgi:hypothetical protein